MPNAPISSDAPTVLACSGFLGMKDIHPARFARALCDRGDPFFSFDYRGFGQSEGPPRRVRLEGQVGDHRWLMTLPTLAAV